MDFKARVMLFARRYRFPLVALVVCLLSYGLLIPWLGFYWDDWQVVLHAQLGTTADFIRLYSYDRPFSVWTALLSGPVLGSSALAWHLFALLLRWLLVLAMAWSLGLVWPGQRQAVKWAALLFAVYPVYFQQPIAVAFSQHLIAYILFFVSLGAMLLARQRRDRFWRWTILALATELLHLATVEHFAGLELLRPFLLLSVIQNDSLRWRQKLKRVFGALWPYLLTLVIFSLWRLVWLKLPVQPHPLELVNGLNNDPLATLVGLSQDAIQGLVLVLASTWGQVLQPMLFDLGDRALLLSWAVCLTAGGAAFVWSRHLGHDKDAGTAPMAWIWLGPLAVLLGLLPVWLIGEQILQSGYHEHLVLPALLGASLFWAGLVLSLVQQAKQQVLVLAVLIGLAAAGQFRVTNALRNDWLTQQRFYQQLVWRAPDLLPDTALASSQRLTTYTQNSALSAALNLLYPRQQELPHLNFWNVDLSLTGNVDALREGEVISASFRGMHFRAEDNHSVVLYFLPETGCLWLLSPMDENNPYLPLEERSLAGYSNLNRVKVQPEVDEDWVTDIFGRGNTQSWCYFYERAELQRQHSNWPVVVDLYQAAFSVGLGPDNGIELLGLVDAYAHLGEWTEAIEVSREVFVRHTYNQPMLCALWERLAAEQIGLSPETLAQVHQMAACSVDG